MTAADILTQAAETFRERAAVYGDNPKRYAKAMVSLFPNGITLASANDHERFHLLALAVVKLTRYAVAVDRGETHLDSLRDASVYFAMLEDLDAKIFLRDR